MNYYKIDVSLNNWNVYKRVLKSEKDVTIEDIKDWILKDIFYKIEDWDLQEVTAIDFEEISEDVFQTIKNEENRINLILDSANWCVARQLTWIN